VLLVSLVLLLILTLFGIGSMGTTLLQLQMTGNFQQSIQAFNEAERDVLLAEIEIEEMVEATGRFDFNAEKDAYYDSSTSLVDVLKWDALTARAGHARNQRSEYVIEYLGKKRLPGESRIKSPDGGIPGDSAYAYIVTARSESGRGSVRTLQSVYTTFDAP
jgi:Tfp pilus assembly protein PilX